jgi:hypothetical protein
MIDPQGEKSSGTAAASICSLGPFVYVRLQHRSAFGLQSKSGQPTGPVDSTDDADHDTWHAADGSECAITTGVCENFGLAPTMTLSKVPYLVTSDQLCPSCYLPI